MTTFFRSLILALGLVTVATSGGIAAEPVRSIDIYVQPYYEAGGTPDAAPLVAVGDSFSGLLASTRREDIVAARDKVIAAPGLVTPMTMMVLAIRLYDVGLRDDAVFWFYAAKDRYLTLAAVIDVPAAGLLQVDDAVGSFVELAGPFINGYAFCDRANQAKIRGEALDWVEAHPYDVMFMAKLPALPGSRKDNLAKSIADLRAGAAKERQYFDDPARLAEFVATRQQNDMDAKFCWK